MHKLKYLLKRIINLDYANMLKIAKAIHKKTHKNTLLLLLDIIYCGIVFQAGYYDYQEFEFYNLNNKERKTYLTRGKNNEIVRRFNNKEYFHFFESKVEFNQTFAEFIKRDWLLIDEDSKDAFLDFFKKHQEIIVKPIDGSGGLGIEAFHFENDAQASDLFQSLISNKQLLIEEFIHQHADMNRLYANSVNTLRMFTFIKDGTPYFLQAILKIGNGGVVDNFSSGGMYTYLDENGKAFVSAIDQKDNIFDEHPITKEKIIGFQVPMFEKAVELVKNCSKVIPQVAYVGWDVAITVNGPELIEGNDFPGVFQVKPSLSNTKEGLIPKYQKIMNIF